mmetsp:Transcript_6898/g.12381  ORF Transcript_6898/g.12381 Transcript_6898/m.12381 type:complete len:209 (-) Transcript_6898:985-1611(-)
MSRGWAGGCGAGGTRWKRRRECTSIGGCWPRWSIWAASGKNTADSMVFSGSRRALHSPVCSRRCLQQHFRPRSAPSHHGSLCASAGSTAAIDPSCGSSSTLAKQRRSFTSPMKSHRWSAHRPCKYPASTWSETTTQWWNRGAPRPWPHFSRILRCTTLTRRTIGSARWHCGQSRPFERSWVDFRRAQPQKLRKRMDRTQTRRCPGPGL